MGGREGREVGGGEEVEIFNKKKNRKILNNIVKILENCSKKCKKFKLPLTSNPMTLD